MQGTGLDSPFWLPNLGRTIRNARLPKFTMPTWRLPTWRLPTLDREDKLWLTALAGLVLAFTAAATGPWG